MLLLLLETFLIKNL